MTMNHRKLQGEDKGKTTSPGPSSRSTRACVVPDSKLIPMWIQFRATPDE